MSTLIRTKRPSFGDSREDADNSLKEAKHLQRNYLRFNIKQKGWSNQELALHFGTSPAEVSTLLSNEYQKLSLEKMLVFSLLIDSKLGLVSSKYDAQKIIENNKLSLIREIALRIESQMKKTGMTQSQIGSNYFNVSQAFISDLINIKSLQKFKFDTLRIYGYICGLTEDQLDEYEK